MPGESQQTPTHLPDPSVLTTEALERAVRAERGWVEGQIETLRERLRGMDEATKVLHETVTEFPTDVQQAVGHQRQLNDEKFASVNQQLVLVERQRVEQKADTQKAVDAALISVEKAISAALAAQKEAVTKAEIANDKRFESVNEFRAQLNDQAATFLSRAEYDANHTALIDKVDTLATTTDAKLTSGWGEHRRITDGQFGTQADRIQTLTVQAATFISRTELNALLDGVSASVQRNIDRLGEIGSRLDRIEGRGGGTNQTILYVFAAIAAIGTFVAIYFAIHNGALISTRLPTPAASP